MSKSEETSDSFFQMLPVSVCYLRHDKKGLSLLSINQALLKLLGINESEAENLFSSAESLPVHPDEYRTVSVPLAVPDKTRKDAGGNEAVPFSSFSEPPAALSGHQILLAEDNPLNTEIACHILGKAGLCVDTAANGKEALDKLTSSEEGFYDAVIMDIRMPVMNGLQTAKSIRTLNRSDRNIPIIAMSANAFEEDMHAALNAGMNAYVIKPIDTSELYSTLLKFL